MRTLSYSESRANYAETLDRVVNDREEVIITRSGHESVVILPLDEYESLKEMAYLTRNPANAKHLYEALDELRAGGGVLKTFDDLIDE